MVHSTGPRRRDGRHRGRRFGLDMPSRRSLASRRRGPQGVQSKGAPRPRDDRLDGLAAAVADHRRVGPQVDVKGSPRVADRRRLQGRFGLWGRFGAAVLVRQAAMPEDMAQPGRHPDVERARRGVRVAVQQHILGGLVICGGFRFGLGFGCRRCFGAGRQTGRTALLMGGAAVGIDGQPLVPRAARHAGQPLPDVGGGDVKDVAAGAGRQRHHDQVGRRTAAQQQQRAAQKPPDRPAAEPGVDPVVVAGHPHLGHREPLGRDVRKDHRRPAQKSQPQQQLDHAGGHRLFPGGQHGHIADRRPQHETAGPKQPEQDVVGGVPGGLPVYKSQQSQQDAPEQGDAAGQQPALGLLPAAAAPGR